MDRPIDRWPAAVDADVARFERDELALLTGQGVPELDAHQMGSMSATARAETGPAGNSRPRSPSPAAPSNASATAWRATSPSEWPWSLGALSIVIAPRASGRPAPNEWLSSP